MFVINFCISMKSMTCSLSETSFTLNNKLKSVYGLNFNLVFFKAGCHANSDAVKITRRL